MLYSLSTGTPHVSTSTFLSGLSVTEWTCAASSDLGTEAEAARLINVLEKNKHILVSSQAQCSEVRYLHQLALSLLFRKIRGKSHAIIIRHRHIDQVGFVCVIYDANVVSVPKAMTDTQAVLSRSWTYVDGAVRKRAREAVDRYPLDATERHCCSFTMPLRVVFQWTRTSYHRSCRPVQTQRRMSFDPNSAMDDHEYARINRGLNTEALIKYIALLAIKRKATTLPHAQRSAIFMTPLPGNDVYLVDYWPAFLEHIVESTCSSLRDVDLIAGTVTTPSAQLRAFGIVYEPEQAAWSLCMYGHEVGSEDDGIAEVCYMCR